MNESPLVQNNECGPVRDEMKMKSDDEEENMINLRERNHIQSHEESPPRDLFVQSRLPKALEHIWQALPKAKPEAARKSFATFDRTDWAIFVYIDLSSRFRDMRAAQINKDNSLRIMIHESPTDLFVTPNPHEESPALPIDEMARGYGLSSHRLLSVEREVRAV